MTKTQFNLFSTLLKLNIIDNDPKVDSIKPFFLYKMLIDMKSDLKLFRDDFKKSSQIQTETSTEIVNRLDKTIEKKTNSLKKLQDK